MSFFAEPCYLRNSISCPIPNPQSPKIDFPTFIVMQQMCTMYRCQKLASVHRKAQCHSSDPFAIFRSSSWLEMKIP